MIDKEKERECESNGEQQTKASEQTFIPGGKDLHPSLNIKRASAHTHTEVIASPWGLVPAPDSRSMACRGRHAPEPGVAAERIVKVKTTPRPNGERGRRQRKQGGFLLSPVS
jgi:hypothetical protein